MISKQIILKRQNDCLIDKVKRSYLMNEPYIGEGSGFPEGTVPVANKNCDNTSVVRFNFANSSNSTQLLTLFYAGSQSIQNSVSAFPPSTITASVTVGTSPTGIAFNPTNNTLYVTSFGSNIVTVIDVATNSIITTIVLGTNPEQIAYNSFNNSMYICNISSSTVSVVNCSTNTVVATISTACNGIDYCPVNNSMYVSTTAGTTKVINCSSNTVVATISGLGTGSEGVTYANQNNSMYVNNPGSANVSVINCSSNTVVATISVGTNPQFSAYNTLSNTIYVANASASSLSVINCSSNTVVATISGLGVNPAQVTYNSLNNLIYVTNFSSTFIDAIDCSTNTISSTITTPSGGRGIVYVSNTNSIYSIFASNNSVATISPSVSTTGNSANYNSFVSDIAFNPIKVCKIVFQSSDFDQLKQQLIVASQDMTGVIYNYTKNPNADINMYQAQDNVVELYFNNLIMDGYTFFQNYPLLAQQNISMTMYYTQMNTYETYSTTTK